jgi:hypothetical protein
MPEVATDARRSTWLGTARRALLVPLTAGLACGLYARAARADAVDACIAAAEASQVEKRELHLRTARDKLLFCARDACPGAIQKDCKRWLAEVEARLPSVVLRVVDAGGGEVGRARVLVDGALLADTLDGRAVPVDPGEHTFRVEAGNSAVVQRIVIREGEQSRLLSLKLPAAAPSGSPSRIPTGAWVVGGIGAAGLAAGVALWIVGLHARSDLYATCGVMHGCAPSSVDHARTELVAGDVAAGLGIAAVGAAVVWALVAPSAPRLPVGARSVPGGGVVEWRASF